MNFLKGIQMKLIKTSSHMVKESYWNRLSKECVSNQEVLFENLVVKKLKITFFDGSEFNVTLLKGL